MPARRKCGPSRWSSPTPRATSTTSAPTSSQTFAISLMKLMRVERKAFAASFTSSAECTSVRTITPSMPPVQLDDAVGVVGVECADDDPVRGS